MAEPNMDIFIFLRVGDVRPRFDVFFIVRIIALQQSRLFMGAMQNLHNFPDDQKFGARLCPWRGGPECARSLFSALEQD
jgi:hypothetical protein